MIARSNEFSQKHHYGLYYNPLRIRNLRTMDIFHCKLVSFPLSVKNTLAYTNTRAYYGICYVFIVQVLRHYTFLLFINMTYLNVDMVTKPLTFQQWGTCYTTALSLLSLFSKFAIKLLSIHFLYCKLPKTQWYVYLIIYFKFTKHGHSG